jgi:AhpD family alkylhydroperoxidase
MNYAQISQETIGHLYKCHGSLKESELDQKLRVLVELRVSQLNGCALCCGLHSDEARKLGVEQVKLDKLPGWALAHVFSDSERLALEWCDALTLMKGELREIRTRLEAVFSDRELVDLTAAISLMNALNRIAITLGDHH